MITRDKLLDKIRALLTKTTENGCTEAEMLSSLAKARAMCDAHAVTDEELQIAKEVGAILHEEPDDPSDPHRIKWRLGAAIEEFCDCKVWRNPCGGLTFCGTASDAQWAVWLLDHLTDFVSSELVLHLMTSLAPRSERARVIKGFVIGCTERISERIHELCQQSETAQSDNSRALTVIKSTAIADKIKELGIKLRRSSSRSASFDDGALEAGRKAGEQASFGRPVSGASGAPRLARKGGN